MKISFVSFALQENTLGKFLMPWHTGKIAFFFKCQVLFYRLQTKFAQVMFLHVSVILSTRGGDLPHFLLGYTPTHPPGPEAGTPPPGPEAGAPLGPEVGIPSGSRPPWDQRQVPPVQCMLGDTGNKRAVRILLECNLVKC